LEDVPDSPPVPVDADDDFFGEDLTRLDISSRPSLLNSLRLAFSDSQHHFHQIAVSVHAQLMFSPSPFELPLVETIVEGDLIPCEPPDVSL
jgi:hypothetical protein